jgi:selenocysteine lyase/cysteine desulfurase
MAVTRAAATVASVDIDVMRARADTPGCQRVAHFNSAGAALPPSVVTDAVVAHLRREADIGGYEAEKAQEPAIERTYAAIAELIGCQPGDVALLESATRAWDAAFYGLRLGSGDRILTARAEYASNVIAFLQVARRTGAVVEVVDDTPTGELDVADLRRRMGPDVKLVAITHVPTQSGLVNPAAEVGAVTRAAGVPFLLDACQSVGQLTIDVAEIGCDMLSATGRKFLRGPRGTGFLYVSPEMLDRVEPPELDLRAATWTAPDRYEMQPDARRFESWECSVAGRIGLGVAVDYALARGMPAIERRIGELAGVLRERLAARPGVTLRDQGRQRCGIVSFTIDGVPAPDVVRQLTAAGVNAWLINASNALYDLGSRGLDQVVRASVHYYNTVDEIGRLCDALPTPVRP